MNVDLNHLHVDTDRLKEVYNSMISNSDDMMSAIEYIAEIVSTIPQNFQGPISDAYVESFMNYIEQLRKIYMFNEEFLTTLQNIQQIYEEKDSDYAELNRFVGE